MNDFSDDTKPELRTLLKPENLNNMLKKFISTDGFSPDIMSEKKLDNFGKPTDESLKVIINNAKLLKCYIHNISVILHCRLNKDNIVEIPITELDEETIMLDNKYSTVEALRKRFDDENK
jgi:hypothetical protein